MIHNMNVIDPVHPVVSCGPDGRQTGSLLLCTPTAPRIHFSSQTNHLTDLIPPIRGPGLQTGEARRSANQSQSAGAVGRGTAGLCSEERERGREDETMLRVVYR